MTLGTSDDEGTVLIACPSQFQIDRGMQDSNGKTNSARYKVTVIVQKKCYYIINRRVNNDL